MNRLAQVVFDEADTLFDDSFNDLMISIIRKMQVIHALYCILHNVCIYVCMMSYACVGSLLFFLSFLFSFFSFFLNLVSPGWPGSSAGFQSKSCIQTHSSYFMLCAWLC